MSRKRLQGGVRVRGTHPFNRMADLMTIRRDDDGYWICNLYRGIWTSPVTMLSTVAVNTVVVRREWIEPLEEPTLKTR